MAPRQLDLFKLMSNLISVRARVAQAERAAAKSKAFVSVELSEKVVSPAGKKASAIERSRGWRSVWRPTGLQRLMASTGGLDCGPGSWLHERFIMIARCTATPPYSCISNADA